jgi:hypothetical protein
VFADIFTACFFIVFYAWVLVMAALTISSLAVGICLITGLNVHSLIPPMPYGCGLIFAVSFIALAALAAIGTFYCAAFVRQLMRSYTRFHKNTIAAASGIMTLPAVAINPQFSLKTRRIIRGLPS